MLEQFGMGLPNSNPARVDPSFVRAGRPVQQGRDHVCRPAEREAIARLAAQERDDALLISGPTGSGKTFLVENAHRTLDMTSHFIQSSPAERDWVYSGLSVALTLLPPGAAPDLVTEILEGTDRPAALLGVELLEVVRGLHLTPTVLLIDDLDQVDEASQRLIGFIARRLSGTGIRLVGTVREPPRTGPLAGLACRELEPLEHDRALDLVKELVEGEIHPSVALAVVRYASGHPLAIREMLEGIGEAQLVSKAPIPLPLRPGPGSTAAVEEQLDGLSPGALAALQTLSTAPALPVSSLELNGHAVDELHDAQVIRRVGPTLSIAQHRVRAAVYWQLTPEARMAEHRALAEDLAEIDPLLAIWQQSFGESSPTITELLVAVVSLVRRGDQIAGIELAARALCLGHPGPEEALLMLDAAELFLDKCNFSVAKGLIAQAGAATDEPRVQIRVAILKVRVAFLERRELLEGLVRAAVAIFGHAEVRQTCALLNLAAATAAELWLFDLAEEWWAEAERFAAAQLPDPHRETEGAEPEALATGDGDAVAEVNGFHLAIGRYLGALGRARADLAPVPTTPPLEKLVGAGVRPALLYARGLTFAEEYGEARAVLVTAGQLRVLTPLDEATRQVFILDNELRAGNLHLAREAVRHIESGEPDVLPSLRAYLLARFWVERGEPKPVAHWVDTVTRLSSTAKGAALAARMYASLGRARLMQGRYDEAIRLLTLADRSGARIANPLLIGHEADLIEALAIGGHSDRAADALAHFIKRLEANPSQWGTLVLGRSRALLLGGRHGVSALRRHLDAWPATRANGYHYDFEYYRSLFTLGLLHHALDQHAEARDAFSRAVTGMQGIGQDGWVSNIRTRFLDVQGRPEPSRHPAFGQLTSNERLVVEKVLGGKRNRDIAEELFVSLRTVEVRLTNVYRRLGVRSRAQLMALLNGGESGDTGSESPGD